MSQTCPSSCHRPRLIQVTLSASSRNDSGMASPSAFAVLRLINSSKRTGCCTGSSAGLVPSRILSRLASLMAVSYRGTTASNVPQEQRRISCIERIWGRTETAVIARCNSKQARSAARCTWPHMRYAWARAGSRFLMTRWWNSFRRTRKTRARFFWSRSANR